MGFFPSWLPSAEYRAKTGGIPVEEPCLPSHSSKRDQKIPSLPGSRPAEGWTLVTWATSSSGYREPSASVFK